MSPQVLLETPTDNTSAFVLNFSGHLNGNLNIAVLIYVCTFRFLKEENLKALTKAILIALPVPSVLTYFCWFIFGTKKGPLREAYLLG